MTITIKQRANFYHNYIYDCFDNSIKKFTDFIKHFKAVKKWEIKNNGIYNALDSMLRGICTNIEFENAKIIKLFERCEKRKIRGDKESLKITSNYWQFMANQFFKFETKINAKKIGLSDEKLKKELED